MKYVAEFLGTFMFLSAILQATSASAPWPALTPLLIVVGLLAAITVTASTSGAHLNPAVSVLMFLKQSLPAGDLVPYVGAQLLGAVAAKMVFDMLQKR